MEPTTALGIPGNTNALFSVNTDHSWGGGGESVVLLPLSNKGGIPPGRVLPPATLLT